VRPGTAPATRPIPEARGTATTPLVRDGGNDPFLRRFDGRVVRVLQTDTLIIDLGAGDPVTNGTALEVYDAQTGLPVARAARGTDLPQGKATVEVIRVMPGYSECRVIRREAGVALNIGDLVVKNPSGIRRPE
jgi:hypothetical protein